MIELKVINNDDPLKRKAERQKEQEEFSPMDPPDAYAPPNLKAVPYEEMHSFLQTLVDEHKTFIKELDVLEQALANIKEVGLNRDALDKITDFFRFYDNHIIEHNRKEERTLFPLLHKRLLEKGEHSTNDAPVTGVDMLEDEHLKSFQHAAVVFNFLGMASRLPDQNSRLVMLDAALEQGKVLIEDLRLHIFREENIAFSQAHQYITLDEFDDMK